MTSYEDFESLENVSSSAHYRGCVVNGSGAMAAI